MMTIAESAQSFRSGYHNLLDTLNLFSLLDQCVALSFKSIRIPVTALLLFTQTVNAQQGPLNAGNTTTDVQGNSQRANSSRYPMHPAVFQRDSMGTVPRLNQTPPYSPVGQSMPGQFGPAGQVMPQQFWPPPTAAQQYQSLPPQMNFPPQPAMPGINESGQPFATQPARIPAEDLRWSFNFQQAPWPVVLRTFAREAGFSLQMAVEPAGDFTDFDENQ